LLYKSEGTDNYWLLNLRTERLDSIGQFQSITNLTEVPHPDGSRLLFNATDLTGRKLIGSINSQSEYEEIQLQDFVTAQLFRSYTRNTVICVSQLPSGQTQIWETDGTMANTKLLDLFNRNLDPLKLIGDVIYFSELSPRQVVSFDLATTELTEIVELNERDYELNDVFTIDSVEFVIIIGWAGNNRILRIDQGSTELVAEFRRSYFYDPPTIVPVSLRDAQLALLRIEPFGNEFYYIHKDGTLELLFDLNPGNIDMVPYNMSYEELEYKVLDDDLYFIGSSIPEGRQVWRFPLEYFTDTAEDEKLEAISLSIFPNPTISTVQVELGDEQVDKVQWQLISVDGRIPQSGSSDSARFSIDRAGEAAGSYYVVVQTKGRKLAKLVTWVD